MEPRSNEPSSPSSHGGQAKTELSARSTGIPLILVVNIVAVLIVGLGVILGQIVYGDWRVQQDRQRELGITEEWQVVVRWTLEKETELQDKEDQIDQFEQRIAVLLEKERLLRGFLAIAQERGSLEQVPEDVGVDTIEELQQEIEDTVAQFNDLQAQLQQANAERDVLADAFREGIPGVDSQTLADEEADEIHLEVARLQEAARLERFISEEIQARYERVISALLSGDLSGASERIDMFRTYLQDGPASGNRVVKRRSLLDRSLLSLLDEAVEARRNVRAPIRIETSVEVERDPETLVRTRSLIADAAVLADAGDTQGSIVGYRAAFAQMPDIAAAVDALYDQELRLASQRAGGLVTEARSAEEDGNAGRARTLYQSAAQQLPPLVSPVVAELIDRSAALALSTYQALLADVQATADRTARELDQVRASLAAQESALQSRQSELDDVRVFVDAVGNELEHVVENLALVDTDAAIAAIESLPHGELLEQLQDAVVSAILQISAYATEVGAYIDSLSQSLRTRSVALDDLTNDLAILDSGLVTLGAMAADADLRTIVDTVRSLPSASTLPAFEQTAVALMERSSSLGFAKARSASLATVRDVVAYLDGVGESDPSALLDRVRSDTLMQTAVIEIQDLVIAGASRPELPLGQVRLLGVVTSVMLDRLAVDVLTAVDAPVGVRAVIRRRIGELEIDVGEATVDSVDGDRAEITLVRYIDSDHIEPRDLVFLVIE